ncbi:MAG: hypothetical protein M3120_00735 [Pseudomonadota bacterium]|nr:hypothetical protein [Pseudomonadota bacterium]
MKRGQRRFQRIKDLMTPGIRRCVRVIERRLKPPQDPAFALITYDTDEERDGKVAELPACVRSIICIPNMARSIEA